MMTPAFGSAQFSGITELDYFAGIAFGKLLELSNQENGRLSGITKDQVIEYSFDGKELAKREIGLEEMPQEV